MYFFPKPIFGHRQLYAALSRATSPTLNKRNHVSIHKEQLLPSTKHANTGLFQGNKQHFKEVPHVEMLDEVIIDNVLVTKENE